MNVWDNWETGDVILYRHRGTVEHWSTRATHGLIRSVQKNLRYGPTHSVYSHVALYVSHGIVIDSTRSRGVHPSSIALDQKTGFEFTALRLNDAAREKWGSTEEWPANAIEHCNAMMGRSYNTLAAGQIGLFAAQAYARSRWSEFAIRRLNRPEPPAPARPEPNTLGHDDGNEQDALICSELVWTALLAASDGKFRLGARAHETPHSLPADFSACTYFDRVATTP